MSEDLNACIAGIHFTDADLSYNISKALQICLLILLASALALDVALHLKLKLTEKRFEATLYKDTGGQSRKESGKM